MLIYIHILVFYRICFLQIHTVAAKYIMKCDDDTFVRVDSIVNDVRQAQTGRSLYMGNMNYHHRPLRYGKWAVTYEVQFSYQLLLKSASLFSNLFINKTIKRSSRLLLCVCSVIIMKCCRVV